MAMDESSSLAVIGAGPVGLTLALQAARSLPQARVTVFDARAADADVAADARTIALSLGSVQLLQRLGAWNGEAAQRITEVHVSQQPPSLPSLRPASPVPPADRSSLLARWPGGRSRARPRTHR